MYGTEFMSKSLSFIWCHLGTKLYYNVDIGSHHRILEELSRLIDSGKIKCHLGKRLKFTLDGLKEAHEVVESGKRTGKVALEF